MLFWHTGGIFGNLDRDKVERKKMWDGGFVTM